MTIKGLVSKGRDRPYRVIAPGLLSFADVSNHVAGLSPELKRGRLEQENGPASNRL
jgi:hypothetical protein